MIKNYFKIAARNLLKYKTYTLINIGGLAIGMTGALLISLFIYDELSFDKMFPDSDRIYRVNIDNKTSGEISYYAAVSGPLAAAIQQDYPHAEMVTRFRKVGSILLRKSEAEQNVKEEHVTGVDSTFFSMFGFDLIVGDPKTALKDPKTLILTKTAAEKHFKLSEALGQSLLLNNSEEYTVTGVIEDMPKNSFLRDHSVFISISSFEDAKSNAWNNWIFPTFVKLHPGTDVEYLQSYLSTVTERYLIPWAMTFVPGLTLESARASDRASGNFMNFNATPLTRIHLHSSNRKGEFSTNNDIQNIYILSLIGLFLIILASVNFMNLSTAYSLKRAREVGIRKTLGSNRSGLIRQFLCESGLISLLSLLVAMVLIQLALPFFNELAGKAISIPFSSPFFWLSLVSALVFLSLFSGSYPAFFMSGFLPVKSLKDNGASMAGTGNIRNSLVVFQFAISILLIACTLVVYQQLDFIQNKELGYQKEQVLVIDDIRVAEGRVKVFKEEVKQLGQVENTSLSSYLPTPSSRGSVTYFMEGAMESKTIKSENAMIIGRWKIDYDYLSTLDIEIIAGRNFDKKFATDSSAIIINEATVAMLGVSPEEAIGIRLTDDFHREDKENMNYWTIIGVTKNFHFESLRESIDALSFSLGNQSNAMVVKLNAGDLSNTIAMIEEKWKKVAPGQPFNYYFMEDSFNKTYEAEQRLGRIFTIFTILSILIACLGLFGLAAFNAEKRSKEIGVRKVLGASISQIMYKLSADFLKLVGIAIIISLPLAWYVMNKWLEDFSYRIEIGWEIFALAAILAVVISIITVSYQSIKAAIANPIKSLRTE